MAHTNEAELHFSDVPKIQLESPILMHDDAKCEYAYGPAQGLPDTKVGSLSQGMYDMAKKQGWTIISMKNDWKKVFAFEK